MDEDIKTESRGVWREIQKQKQKGQYEIKVGKKIKNHESMWSNV